MIKEAYEKLVKEITPLMIAYPWSDIQAYGAWLSQQYHIVKHSTPMLALSCGRSISNRPYHLRCIEHLSEEKGHDKMLLNDLRLSKLELMAELPSTRAFYATQYFQIEHVNPVSFLGYVLFMEALAVAFGRHVSDRASLSTNGITFLELHADEDDGHIESAFKLITTMTKSDQMDVVMNLRMSAKCYETMMQDLAALRTSSLAA